MGGACWRVLASSMSKRKIAQKKKSSRITDPGCAPPRYRRLEVKLGISFLIVDWRGGSCGAEEFGRVYWRIPRSTVVKRRRGK